MSSVAMASAILVGVQAARAENRVVVADFSTAVPVGGTPAGWELNEKSGKAHFAVVKDGGISAARPRRDTIPVQMLEDLHASQADR